MAGWSMAAAVTMLEGPREIAIVGPAGAARESLVNLARHDPNAVVVVADEPSEDIGLLSGRTAVDGRPTAYVCRHHVCSSPVADVTALRELLQGAPPAD
jgi:uncharacterized protein YyaL (SSP411 family)